MMKQGTVRLRQRNQVASAASAATMAAGVRQFLVKPWRENWGQTPNSIKIARPPGAVILVKNLGCRVIWWAETMRVRKGNKVPSIITKTKAMKMQLVQVSMPVVGGAGGRGSGSRRVVGADRQSVATVGD